MILMSPITVHTQWMSAGSFFIWAEMHGSELDAEHLRSLLFAWHEPSFYGTFIEIGSLDRKEGLLLSAEEALDYFAKPLWNEHALIQWDEDSTRLLDAAPDILTAREQDAIVPDFYKWKRGQAGWKLLLDPEEHRADSRDTDRTPPLSSIVEVWLDHLMAERLPNAHARMMLWNSPSVAQSGTEVGVEHTPFDENPEGASLDDAPQEAPVRAPDGLFEDERDWLVSIGWLPDPAPFRVCLQIQEPDAGSAWMMSIV
ncbi:MAG: helicase, partial [Paenibacillus sp.]|nr:helicase [Paenibacillus sp.]